MSTTRVAPAENATRAEVLSRLGEPDFVLVNALPRAAYDAEHIAGSVSLPLEEMPARAREVLPDPNRDIVVYCASRF